jgi:hypothetical protein
MRKRWIYMAPLAILGMVLFIGIGGIVVRELWNLLLPVLFGWTKITFWQAIALLALCRILFGGLGGRGFGRSHYGRRWERMTPEERERFREGMRGRCAGAPPQA